MNTLLWILQAILAIKFLSVAFSHGLRQDPAKFDHGRRRLGSRGGPVLALVALGTLLGGVGVALPAAIRSPGLAGALGGGAARRIDAGRHCRAPLLPGEAQALGQPDPVRPIGLPGLRSLGAGAALGLQMATFSAHTASPPPPSRTPAG